MLAPWPPGQVRICSVHSQYSGRVSPFQAKTGTPCGSSGVPSAHDDGRSGLVLGRVDVAGGPADLGAERGQRLDEHGGLHGHVQRAGDAGALERLGRPELLAQGHQAGHLVLGQADLVTAGLGEAQVGNLVVKGHGDTPGVDWLVFDPAQPIWANIEGAGYHPRRRCPSLPEVGAALPTLSTLAVSGRLAAGRLGTWPDLHPSRDPADRGVVR